MTDIVAELDRWVNTLQQDYPELHRLSGALQRARDEIVALRKLLYERNATGVEAQNAFAAVRIARAEALEEVAQFIKQRGGWLTVAALIADIRALKDKP